MRIPFPLALMLAALSGFIALTYEIVWARVYNLATASRPVAFGLMLGSYLVGLAFGSLLSRHWQNRGTERQIALRSLSRLIVSSNAIAFLVVPLVARVVVFTHWALTLPLVAVATMLLGTLLPLLCHSAIPTDERVGARMSYVYIANIVGSGLGSLVTGFFLFEHLALWQIQQGLLSLALLLSVAVGCFAARSRADPVFWVLTGGLVLLAPFLHDGLFERLQFRADFSTLPRFEKIVETRHSVITIDRDHRIYGGGIYDGMIETRPVLGGGLLRPYFISALHAAPRKVLVVGVSGGAWTQILASHPQVEHVTAVEIDPGYLKVIKAYPEVSSLLTNPKVEFVIDDGRRWLRRNPERRFDVIVMNTSFHWREFASALLGREFLELVQRHLAPGGILMWNCTGSSRAIATGMAVFPHTIMVLNNCVGSNAPLVIDRDRWRSILSSYRIDGRPSFDLATVTGRADLERMLAVADPDDRSGSLMDRPAMEAAYGNAMLITDDNLGEEYAFVLGDNLFLQRLLGR
jgi:predicted membrane-bound spermidine synthase